MSKVNNVHARLTKSFAFVSGWTSSWHASLFSRENYFPERNSIFHTGEYVFKMEIVLDDTKTHLYFLLKFLNTFIRVKN